MGWIPQRSAHGRRDAAALAARVAARDANLKVALFRLEDQLDAHALSVPLAAALAGFGISANITVAGPHRVQAVLDGALERDAVLVVLAGAGEAAHDALMELVEWLIANGRRELAGRIVFVPVGSRSRAPGTFPFAHVPLPALNAAGAPRGWRADSARLEQLLLAVLDQALGLA